MNVATLEPYITLENFTRFENIPASQWGRTEGYTLEGDSDGGFDLDIVRYGLW